MKVIVLKLNTKTVERRIRIFDEFFTMHFIFLVVIKYFRLNRYDFSQIDIISKQI